MPSPLGISGSTRGPDSMESARRTEGFLARTGMPRPGGHLTSRGARSARGARRRSPLSRSTHSAERNELRCTRSSCRRPAWSAPLSRAVYTPAFRASTRERTGREPSPYDCHDAPRGRRLVPVAERPALLIDPLQLLHGVAIRRDQTGFSGDGPNDLGDIEVAIRVDREAVRRAEAPRRAWVRTAQSRDDGSVRVEHAHAARPIALDRSVPERALTRAPTELGDVHPAARENDLRRPLDVGDLPDEATLGREHLDPIAFAIADEYGSCRIDRDPMRQHELPGSGARLAPGRKELATRREPVHAR